MFFSCSGIAQNTESFNVIVIDTNYLPSKYSAALHFENTFFNQLKQTYGITKMAPAYPDANYLFLRWVYTIECNNDSLIYAINQLNASKIKVIGKPHIGVLQCNHPNDYGLVYLGKQENLDFIKADTAWCYSTLDNYTIASAPDLTKLDPIKNISYLS